MNGHSSDEAPNDIVNIAFFTILSRLISYKEYMLSSELKSIQNLTFQFSNSKEKKMQDLTHLEKKYRCMKK